MDERSHLPRSPARSMRWLPDPRTFEVHRPSQSRKGRRILLLGLLIAVLCLIAARLLPLDRVSRSTLEPMGGVTQPNPLPQDLQVSPSPSPSPALAPDDDPAPQASVPLLRSDDVNLSFARRAGLHRTENPLQLTASVGYAVDASSGEVLYARNDQAVLPIASLTKLVTAMVLLDQGVSLHKRITISADDVDRLRNSRSRLPVGTRLTRNVALRLALMSSENRAAHALGRTFPGGLDEFVRQMNLKAKEILALDATFVDPTGLSNANQATARDVASIVAAASNYPLIRGYSTTKRYLARFGKRTLTYLNSNRLLRNDRWPVKVQKTGYIVEAGQCLTLMLQVASRSVIVVLLDAGSIQHRSEDARKLRRWLSINRTPLRSAPSTPIPVPAVTLEPVNTTIP